MNQEPDYTHMQATGQAIEMLAELHKINHLPTSFSVMFHGRVYTVIVQEDEPVASTQEEPQTQNERPSASRIRES